MESKELIEKAKKDLSSLTGFASPAGIGLKKDEKGWVATVEIIEKKSIPDGMDLLGTYEVRMDVKGNMLGYERKTLRKRIDTKYGSEQD